MSLQPSVSEAITEGEVKTDDKIKQRNTLTEVESAETGAVSVIWVLKWPYLFLLQSCKICQI